MSVTIEGEPSYAFQIDRIRFDRVLRKISYALFYHIYKQPWKRELIVVTKNIYTDELQTDEFGTIMKEYEKVLPKDNFDGHNPTIFKYRFGDTNKSDLHNKVLRMIFYEGFHVLIVPRMGTIKANIDR